MFWTIYGTIISLPRTNEACNNCTHSHALHRYKVQFPVLLRLNSPRRSICRKRIPQTKCFARDHTAHYLNFLPREGGINLNFNSHLIHPCLVSKWCVRVTLCLERIISWEDNMAENSMQTVKRRSFAGHPICRTINIAPLKLYKKPEAIKR